MADLARRAHACLVRILDLPKAEWTAAVDRQCAGDESLRREVERLLLADPAVRRLLEEPVLDLATPRPPASIGPYRPQREIGRGGLATVYLGYREGEEEHRLPVALKVLRRGLDTDDIVRRFHREGNILSQLKHPNIARLYGAGACDDGRPYLVMEYVEGESLDCYCTRNALTLEGRLDLLQKICGVVQHAHRHLVVHRDLKPSNILVTPAGVPKLLDFGIAKLLDPTPWEPLTQTAPGRRLLTLPYASPEQIRGDPVTTAADVYSLGVMLYEQLAGRHPFRIEGQGPGDLQRAILEGTPSFPSLAAAERGGMQANSPRRWSRRLAGDLDRIALKAIARDPGERYLSPADLAEDLHRFRQGLPVSARRATVPYRLGKLLRRRKRELAAAATVLVLAGAFATDRLRQVREVGRAREEAVQATRLLTDMIAGANPMDGDVTVREVLQKSAEKIEALTHQPRLQATLLHAIGRVYTSLALYDEAQEHLDLALEIRRREVGHDSPPVAETLFALGVLQRLQKRLDLARTSQEEALRIRRQRFPARSIEVAESIEELGNLHIEQGDYAAAEALLHQALEIRLEVEGADSPNTAITMNSLARALQNRGDYAAAAKYYGQVLDLWRRTMPQESMAMATTLNNLAIIHENQGELETAIAMHREGLEISRRVVGPEHPSSLNHALNLTTALMRGDDLDAAEAILTETWSRLEGHPDADPLLKASGANSLGILYQTRGRLREADALYGLALEIRRQVHGEAHREIATLLNNRAGIALMRGDWRAADALYASCREIWEQTVDADHPARLWLRHNRAAVLLERGHLEEAEALLLTARDRLREKLGGTHYLVVGVIHRLGLLRSLQGRDGEAEELLREALALRLESLPPGHWRVAATELDLGAVLLDSGRAGEAADRLQSALETFRQVFVPTHPYLLAALVERGRLHLALGQPAAAEQELLEARRIGGASMVADSWRVAEVDSLLGSAYSRLGRSRQAVALLEDSRRQLAAVLPATDRRLAQAVARLAAHRGQ